MLLFNVILHKKMEMNFDKFYRLNYILQNENQAKICKNCISIKINIIKNVVCNIKFFVNGSILCTGISCLKSDLKTIINSIEVQLQNFFLKKINKKNLENFDKFEKVGDLIKFQDSVFLMNNEQEFVGLIKSKDCILIQNISTELCKEKMIFIQKTNNKSKKFFKNGNHVGNVIFDLYNSKYFYNNIHVNINYNNNIITCKDHEIGKIIFKENVEKKIIKNNFFNSMTVLSFNTGFKLNRKVNRVELFKNLVIMGYIAEFKLLNYCAVNLYIDNFIVSIFNSGNVLIKGITNSSNFNLEFIQKLLFDTLNIDTLNMNTPLNIDTLNK